MQLLYGTTNPSKLTAMRHALVGLPLEILGLADLRINWPTVDEQGCSPLDNARQKALAYHAHTELPVFSCDSGLYIQGVPEAEQPGVHARRVAGRALDDEEMIGYYADWATRAGGRLIAWYRNGICLVLPDGRLRQRMDDTIAYPPFYLTDTPHARRTPGFPLDSLSVHIPSGRYFFDLPQPPDNLQALDQGFCSFFRQALTP